uniref:Uncharacterized protein n=1 Tax=Eutreptiella gymnastica TaxID=73025 RepID=A0A7S4FTR1_9EUGL
MAISRFSTKALDPHSAMYGICWLTGATEFQPILSSPVLCEEKGLTTTQVPPPPPVERLLQCRRHMEATPAQTAGNILSSTQNLGCEVHLDVFGYPRLLPCFTGNMATALTTAIQCDVVSRIRSTRVKPQMQPLVSCAFLSVPFFFFGMRLHPLVPREAERPAGCFWGNANNCFLWGVLAQGSSMTAYPPIAGVM